MQETKDTKVVAKSKDKEGATAIEDLTAASAKSDGEFCLMQERLVNKRPREQSQMMRRSVATAKLLAHLQALENQDPKRRFPPDGA